MAQYSQSTQVLCGGGVGGTGGGGVGAEPQNFVSSAPEHPAAFRTASLVIIHERHCVGSPLLNSHHFASAATHVAGGGGGGPQKAVSCGPVQPAAFSPAALVMTQPRHAVGFFGCAGAQAFCSAAPHGDGGGAASRSMAIRGEGTTIRRIAQPERPKKQAPRAAAS